MGFTLIEVSKWNRREYFEQNGKIGLPIAIQAHHAVCDGVHLARFINDLQESMNIFF